MAFSVTAAAARFDQSTKSGADLRAFYEQDPSGAAIWLGEVARASTNPPAELAPLAKASVQNAPIDQLVDLVRQAIGGRPDLFDAVGAAIATARAQTTGAVTLGWAAAIPNDTPMPPPEPAPAVAPVEGGPPVPMPPPVPAAAFAAVPIAAPVMPAATTTPASFVGHLQKNEAGVVQFKTATGVFDVDLSTTDWREEIETTFLRNKRGEPQLLTVKGFPSEDGKRLYVQQFAPGSDPSFIAARVRVEGEKVFLSTIGYGAGANEKIEVTHPEFVKLLRGDEANGLVNYQPAGMILPGLPKVDPATGARTYDLLPEGFFILGRTMKLDVGADETHAYHELDTGYFRATGARAPKNLVVPPQSAPGGAQWDATDSTHGSTTAVNGPRAFFYAKILPHDTKFPDGLQFTRPLQRKLEISAVSDQGDNGVHSPSTTKLSSDFGTVATLVPASAPEHTAAQGSLDPADD